MSKKLSPKFIGRVWNANAAEGPKQFYDPKKCKTVVGLPRHETRTSVTVSMGRSGVSAVRFVPFFFYLLHYGTDRHTIANVAHCVGRAAIHGNGGQWWMGRDGVLIISSSRSHHTAYGLHFGQCGTTRTTHAHARRPRAHNKKNVFGERMLDELLINQ